MREGEENGRSLVSAWRVGDNRASGEWRLSDEGYEGASSQAWGAHGR